MEKIHKENKDNSKCKKQTKFKLVCPNCYKNMKSLKLDDGYIICAWCGLVVYKQKHSLEQIDAPGFIKIPIDKKLRKK